MDPVDDLRHYKLGVFYYNPDDDRVFVPKKLRPFGFQINYARKEVLPVLVGIVLLMIIVIVIAWKF